MTVSERVEENDAVLGGAAVFKGTRLSVVHIGKMADAGESIESILEDYPYLTAGDVKFARLYCALLDFIARVDVIARV